MEVCFTMGEILTKGFSYVWFSKLLELYFGTKAYLCGNLLIWSKEFLDMACSAS